jgi:hypothetical protein
MGAELLPVAVALVIGVLAVPVCYGYTVLCELLFPKEVQGFGILGIAIAILAAVLAISVFLTRGRVKNKMYYGKVMGQYPSVLWYQASNTEQLFYYF